MLQPQLVPIQQLVLAPENTRQNPDPEALAALTASIREQGLLQNLIGYQENGEVRIVAGGHRLRALQALHQEGQGPAQVPVAIVDKTRALILSVSENLARKDLTPLEEAEAITSLAHNGLEVEAIAKELGRSPAYVQGRLRLARELIPEWRKALEERAISVALALALAELAPDAQADLHRRYGVTLRLETVRALKLKDALPAKRLLPAALQAYRERGGATESDLEGAEYLQDRALAQQVQEEAARAQAARMQAEFLLDYPIHQLTTVTSGGQNYVHLNSATLEVRLFFGVVKREAKSPAAPPAAPHPTPPAAPVSPAPTPATPSPTAPTTASTKAPRTISAKGRAEYRALQMRTWRERALADEPLRKAALLMAVVNAFNVGYQPQAGVFSRMQESAFTPPQSPMLGQRFTDLSYEKHLTQELKALLEQAGLQAASKQPIENFLALPPETLDRAFTLAVTLLIGIPHSRTPVRPTLGMADLEHLKAYPSEDIEAALEELKLAAAKTKSDNIKRLLEKPQAVFPQALLQQHK